jgi:hypothetical protein
MHIYVKESVFLELAQARQYTPESIQDCIVQRIDDHLIVDRDHPAYPRALESQAVAPSGALQPPAPTHGPGTELKKLLKKIGITATPNCSCNARARRMDEEEAKEPGWCEAHLDEIVGWLREEATKRGLPFVDMAGRVLVRRAIKNAKRAALDAPATVDGERDAPDAAGRPSHHD